MFLEPTCGMEENQIYPTAPLGPTDLGRGYEDSKKLDIGLRHREPLHELLSPSPTFLTEWNLLMCLESHSPHDRGGLLPLTQEVSWIGMQN